MQTPRDRVWRAAMTFRKGASFTKTSLQEHCTPMVPWTVLDDYLPALELAGYLKRVGGKEPAPGAMGQPIAYTRTKDSYEAPRIDKAGKPVTQGTATLSMWRAMKVLRAFDYREIAQAATLAPVVVAPGSAKSYINALARAGYLQQVKASKPGVPAKYRLVKNTGPHAPAITRRKCVFDRNTGDFAELQSAQEVCDGIE